MSSAVDTRLADALAAVPAAAHPVQLLVGVDVGATNTRLFIRIVSCADGAVLATVGFNWLLKSTRRLLDVLRELEAAVTSLEVNVSGAGFAIAGPVEAGACVPVRRVEGGAKVPQVTFCARAGDHEL